MAFAMKGGGRGGHLSQTCICIRNARLAPPQNALHCPKNFASCATPKLFLLPYLGPSKNAAPCFPYMYNHPSNYPEKIQILRPLFPFINPGQNTCIPIKGFASKSLFSPDWRRELGRSERRSKSSSWDEMKDLCTGRNNSETTIYSSMCDNDQKRPPKVQLVVEAKAAAEQVP